MKTLFIVRHAKSSWKYKNIQDIDRPLKKRGILDAYTMASLLKNQIDKPDTIVSSSANRALHTAVIFCQALKFPLSHLKINKSLYSFKDGYLVKTIKALDDEFSSAIIFSHNHGINDFVNKFGNENIKNVPTCGVVGIRFKNNHWKSLKKGDTFFIEYPKFQEKI